MYKTPTKQTPRSKPFVPEKSQSVAAPCVPWEGPQHHQRAKTEREELQATYVLGELQEHFFSSLKRKKNTKRTPWFRRWSASLKSRPPPTPLSNMNTTFPPPKRAVSQAPTIPKKRFFEVIDEHYSVYIDIFATSRRIPHVFQDHPFTLLEVVEGYREGFMATSALRTTPYQRSTAATSTLRVVITPWPQRVARPALPTEGNRRGRSTKMRTSGTPINTLRSPSFRRGHLSSPSPSGGGAVGELNQTIYGNGKINQRAGVVLSTDSYD